MVVLFMHFGMEILKQKQKIKDLTKATIRCIPLEGEPTIGKCILTGDSEILKKLFLQELTNFK
jgi:hypothetical protein